MKIKVKKDFYDRSADLTLRKKGAEFGAPEKRGRELIDKGFACADHNPVQMTVMLEP